MKRLTIVACIGSLCWTGLALAQPLAATPGKSDTATPVKSVAAPDWANLDAVPPPPVPPSMVTPPAGPSAPSTVAPTAPATVPAGSPGDAQISPAARAHEAYLLQSQAQAESVRRAAVARAEQRTRRIESQRWFGMSNKRPMASVDPYDGDYSPFWASNYPFYPFRWVASGQPWGFVEGE